jgi:hypothetical protein
MKTASSPDVKLRLEAQPKSSFKAKVASNAITAASGMVRIHASTIFPATPQRTALKRLLAPTPMMHALMQCVVETGIPS